MRRTRLILALLLVLALLPGHWLRTGERQDFSPAVTLEALAVPPMRRGPFTLEGAWELTGDPAQFGGFSALVALPDGRFLAGSDTGRRLVFGRPDRGATQGTLDRFVAAEDGAKRSSDLESLTRDPETGTLWGGYEFRESIVRFDPAWQRDAEVLPDAMADWHANAGAEALVRLADGRFLAIEEGARKWRGRTHNAVLFAGDPITAPAPDRLLVELPAGYRPVDATPLDGGRALVLLRRVAWGIPPAFETALALVDVDARGDGKRLSLTLLAEFGDAIPRDNYEGLALTEDADGTHLWLIADDNFMSFQRTLLLKLRWNRTREKARE